MNKFMCSLACTWMTVIDSQLYIIGSLSLDVSLEYNAELVVAWLYVNFDFTTLRISRYMFIVRVHVDI